MNRPAAPRGLFYVAIMKRGTIAASTNYHLGASTAWLCARFGDVYPHETAISHIRRLLSTRFVCKRVCETVPQFKARMRAVQDFMNSDDFSADGGAGLLGLAKALRERCESVVQAKGERLPK